MSRGPGILADEERRSYGAIFVLSVALLLACTVWAIWQDSFSRHLWKKYKEKFYEVAISSYQKDLAEDHDRLEAIPDYVSLTKELDQVRSALADNGAEGGKLRDLQRRLEQAKVRVTERDLDLRVVKGELEEAWYSLETAIHGGRGGDKERARIKSLQIRKGAATAVYAKAEADRDAILADIDRVRAREREIIEALRTYNKKSDAIRLRLDSVSYNLFGHRVPKVPMLEQAVLNHYEKNNFDRWVDRVDRCMNCHVAIDKAGFEDQPNPLKTHPDRKYYLGNHEVRRFGCTPCHGGQGPSINSVEQAHGTVEFWEDPLADVRDKVQARCLACHDSALGLKGAEVAARGEWLFREMGCHGCHLLKGFEDLPKAGPSLKRIAAKASPEWLVSWIENPHGFQPRTRMPEFFFQRDQAVQIAAYLLASSLDDSVAWLAGHPAPAGIDPRSGPLVEKGKQLTQTLGCLGCHGFEPEQFARQVAIGKDVAPNLARVAEKTNARWIYHWIRDPRGYSSTARMPRLRLNNEEARAITSYLLTRTQEPPVKVDRTLRRTLATPETIAAGERLVREYGCFGCHPITGMEHELRISVELSAFGAKHLDELFFGNRMDIPRTWDDWTVNKILTPRTYATERIQQIMPQFGFDRSDARALAIFLASRTGEAVNAAYLRPRDRRAAALRRGRQIVAYYNCQGCHSFEGREGAIRRYYEGEAIENAPPILIGEGKKLQPDWFFDFLMKPVRLRPWLKVRMPTFGLRDDEASGIVEYFAALDGYELDPVVRESEAGAGPVVSPSHHPGAEGSFDCYACHAHPSQKTSAEPASLTTRPLTREQIAAWLADSSQTSRSTGAGGQAKAKALREYLDVGSE